MSRRRVNNSAERKEERRARAVARQLIADDRTPHEQWAKLDRAFGVGKGAKKERAKLLKRIGNGEVEVVTDPIVLSTKQKVILLNKDLSRMEHNLEGLKRQIARGRQLSVERGALERKIRKLQAKISTYLKKDAAQRGVQL